MPILKWSIIPLDQSRFITLDMIEFVGKMLVAGSKQDKRSLVIYYGRTRNLYSCTKSFYRNTFHASVRVVVPIN